jgi:molybdate transport system substrate-binding protein
MRRVVLVLRVLLVVLAACGDDGDDGEQTLTVFAASSLTDAFGEIEAAFEADHPRVDIVVNLAASSALREQILAGAPADVFVSADAANVDQLVDAGETSGEPVDFASNRLQLAVPADNPGGVTGIEDLAREELLVGLCAAEVPCGRFGREALAAAQIEASIDTNEPDVRSLLTKVAAGELDAGVVYRTDVLAAGDTVVGIDLPSGVDVAVTYPIVALTDDDAAREFVAFVLGDEAQAILARYGFGPP